MTTPGDGVLPQRRPDDALMIGVALRKGDRSLAGEGGDVLCELGCVVGPAGGWRRVRLPVSRRWNLRALPQVRRRAPRRSSAQHAWAPRRRRSAHPTFAPGVDGLLQPVATSAPSPRGGWGLRHDRPSGPSSSTSRRACLPCEANGPCEGAKTQECSASRLSGRCPSPGPRLSHQARRRH